MIPAGILASSVAAQGSVLPVTSGLHTWYDATDASTFTYGTGTKVAQWRDKSGNARHLNQATASWQPDRSGNINGVTAVQFSSAFGTRMDTASFTLPQPFTVILVIDGGASSGVSWGLLASQAGTYGGVYAGAGAMLLYAGNNAGVGHSHAGKHAWTGIFNGGSSQIGPDNGLSGFISPGTAGTTTGWRMGAEKSLTGGYFFNGPMGEALVYDRVLTSGERTSLASYLSTKWGTP